MSVTQVNLWECDICHTLVAMPQRVGVYDDPVVTEPEGWISDFQVPEEHQVSGDINTCDACPNCQDQPDWTKYREPV